MKTAVFNSITTALLLGTAAAQVPATISYQGIVTDSNGQGLGTGAPVNRKIVFRIFDDANAGNRLWTEEHTATLANGEFSVLLGSGIDATGTAASESRPSLVSVFGSGSGHFIEITVDNGDNTINASDVPITPRQRIASGAFALRAATADSIAAGETLQLNNSPNDGLGHGSFGGVDFGGPVLFGSEGGALGSKVGATETAALAWDSDGDVGVGVTAPSEKLDVGGNIKASGNVAAGGNVSAVGSVSAANITTPGTVSAANVTTAGTVSAANVTTAGTVSAANVTTTGTVSAASVTTTGTVSAANVTTAGTVSAARSRVSGSEGNGYAFTAPGDTDGGLFSPADGTVTVWTNNAERLRVNPFGNLGVGTNDPKERLDVNGVLNVFDGTKNFSAGLDTEVGGQIINFGTNDSRFGQTINTDRQGGFVRVDTRDNLAVDLFQFVGRSPGSATEGVRASIDHTGKIKSAGKHVAVGEESLRIVRGLINKDGTVISGSTGATVTRTSNGVYDIQFNPAFLDRPAVTVTGTNDNATQLSSGERNEFETIRFISNNKVTISMKTSGNNLSDTGFSFIAIGSR